MKIITKEQPTKRAIKLMDHANRNSSSFITGNPIRVLNYGVCSENKLTYVTFETEGGIEDTYQNKYDCLSSAISSTIKKVVIRNK